MVIFLLVLLLGAGLAAWRGHTHDSRDPEYGLGGLVGGTPPPTAADEAGLAPPSEALTDDAAPLVVPAAWLPQAVVIP